MLDRTPQTARVVALDALRGFDMFWILGMEEVADEWHALSDSWPATAFYTQMDHSQWQGFHFLDLIFPLFVFISGVSLVYSTSRYIERHGRAATVRKMAVRALVLFAFGLFYNFHSFTTPIRVMGVLQRLAICGFAAGLMYCYLGQKARVGVLLGILAGYWATLTFVPVPGGVVGDFAEGPAHNLANWIDFHYLPGSLWDQTHDPEGILSTLPAIATCLLGVLCGEYMHNGSHSPTRKATVLLGAGVVLAALGWLWGLQFPVIKKLWTSSYVLVSGGYSLALLGVFYWIIDVRGLKRWSTPFLWIGMNPITLYMAHRFLKIRWIMQLLAGGWVARMLGGEEKMCVALGVVVANVLLAWVLYRRKIFLRV